MPDRPVREILARDAPLRCAPGDNVKAACVRMTEHKCGSVLICDGEELVGIFTERDVVARVVAQGRDAAKVRLAEVMTRNPATIDADAPVRDAIRAMDEGSIRYLPVLDNGRLVGVISARDLPAPEVGDVAGELDERHRLKERIW